MENHTLGRVAESSVERGDSSLLKFGHNGVGPVRLMDTCSYQLTSDPNVELELSIKPATVGETLFAAVHDRARTRLGGETRAESVTLGDEGWAYGAKSGSEAAVRRARGSTTLR
jgi:hypothetical protein